MSSRLPMTAATAGVATLTGLAPTALAADAPVTYPFPPGVTAELGLTTDPAGNVFFSVSDSFKPNPRIGRLDPSQASPSTPSGFSVFTTPTYTGPGASNLAILRSLDYDDGKGLLWFSRSDGIYGYGRAAELADGTGSGFSFARSPSGVNVQSVAVDQTTHQVWLTEHGARNSTEPGQAPGYFAGNRIAVTAEGLGLTEGPNIAQQGGETSLVSSRYDAKPYGIVPDGSGGAWFTQANPGLPGNRVAHASGVGSYTEYCLTPGTPCTAATTGNGPTAITRAKDGTIWFANEQNSSIVRIDAAGSTFTTFALSGIDGAFFAGRPMSIDAAPDGTVWFATRGSSAAANAIVRLAPSADGTSVAPTIYKTSVAPLSVAVSATGDVWASLSTGLFRIGNATSGAAPTAPSGGGGTGGTTPTDGGGTGGTTPTGADPQGGSAPAQAAPGATVAPTLRGVVGAATVTPPKGPEVRVNQICVGPPHDRCSVLFLLDTRETVTGFPGSKLQHTFGAAPKKKAKKPKSVEVGRTAVVIDGGQTATVTVRLTKKAQALLKKRKKLKVTLRTMQLQPDGKTYTKVSSKDLTFTYSRPKKP